MPLFDSADLWADVGKTGDPPFAEAAFLRRLQTRVLEDFEEFCDRSFGPHDGDELLVTEGGWVYPRHTPVSEVRSVTVDGSAASGFEVVDDSVWIGRSYRRRHGRALDYGFRPRRVTVDYVGGYTLVDPENAQVVSTVPAGLRELALDYGVHLYRVRGRQQDTTMVSVGSGRIRAGDTVRGFPRVIYQRLRRYRRVRGSL